MGPSKHILKEFTQKEDKAPTETIVLTGPMNDHIVPDDTDSQQLQEKEGKNQLHFLEKRYLWHYRYSEETHILLFQGSILVEHRRKSTSNYDQW